MMAVPSKEVKADIANAISGYPCRVTLFEKRENPDKSVLCDFKIIFKNMDDYVIYEDDLVFHLEKYDIQHNNWGWNVYPEFPVIYVSVIFQKGFGS